MRGSPDALHPFDPSLAAFPTRRLPLARVVDLLAPGHAPEVVDRFRLQMARGERFPPVAVVPFAGFFLLADGHKRLEAARALGLQELEVELWTGRRWLQDQRRQAAKHLASHRRALTTWRRNPRRLWVHLAPTLRHWLRVARSLATLPLRTLARR